MASPVRQYTSNSPNFGEATLEGSLLLCLVPAAQSSASESSPAPTISLPSTPGFTWQLAAQIPNPTPLFEFGSYYSVTAAVYYIENAPPMAPTVDTSVNVTPGSGGSLEYAGFQLLEVTGCALADVIDAIVFSYGGQTNYTSGVASAGNLVTSAADFILCFVTDPNFNTEFTAGSGYTLIPWGGALSVYGDAQYQQTFGPGSYPTAFGTGIDGVWVEIAIGFLPTAPTPPVIWTGGGPGFTPTYPPVKKQPQGLWGLEAKRADSIAASGVKQTVFERIDEVTTLKFPFVPSGDLASWKEFETYALSGAPFAYRAIPDYPNAAAPGPMFQYPGDEAMPPGYSVAQMVSMDWTPHFESVGNFSLDLKIRLVEDYLGS